MTHQAPEFQDKPTHPLPMLDEVLDLAPALEANWPAERAAFPPGTLLNDGLETEDPDGGGEGEEDPDAGPETGSDGEEEESFLDSFNLDDVPEEARPAVEALQKEWQGSYTKKRQADRQEVEEARRTAEQTQALIEGLRDPDTMPHYLSLLGVDLNDPETLQRFGLHIEDDDEFDELDEPDPDERIGQLEQQIAAERQAAEGQAELQALDELADQELEQLEEQWDRKLSKSEDVFLRNYAESHPGQDGLPDYEAAAKTLKSALSQGIDAELKRRQASGSRGSLGGKPGGKALDPNKDEDRLALAAQAAEKVIASQQS